MKTGSLLARGAAPCALVAVAVLASAAPIAAAADAMHVEVPIAGGVFSCTGPNGDYQAVSGTVSIVQHTTTTPSGNFETTYALVPHDVVLTDSAGDQFTLRGALRDAQNLNSAGGTGHGSFTAHFEVIARHAGVVDNVALVGHMDQDGNGRFEDSGTCEMPATRPGG